MSPLIQGLKQLQERNDILLIIQGMKWVDSVKYQLGALNTSLLIKNLITNLTKKVHGFQIPFPPISPLFYHIFALRFSFKFP